MPTKKTKTKKKTPRSKTKSKSQKDLHNKVKELEKKHSKLADIKEELRVISMEYADIRSRIEATDVLIDHVIHQLDADRKMREISLVLAVIILVMVALIAVTI